MNAHLGIGRGVPTHRHDCGIVVVFLAYGQVQVCAVVVCRDLRGGIYFLRAKQDWNEVFFVVLIAEEEQWKVWR